MNYWNFWNFSKLDPATFCTVLHNYAITKLARIKIPDKTLSVSDQSLCSDLQHKAKFPVFSTPRLAHSKPNVTHMVLNCLSNPSYSFSGLFELICTNAQRGVWPHALMS